MSYIAQLVRLQDEQEQQCRGAETCRPPTGAPLLGNPATLQSLCAAALKPPAITPAVELGFFLIPEEWKDGLRRLSAAPAPWRFDRREWQRLRGAALHDRGAVGRH